MKVQVLQNFTDKYTNEDYIKDQVIMVDKARGEELLADTRGLVCLVEEKKAKKVE